MRGYLLHNKSQRPRSQAILPRPIVRKTSMFAVTDQRWGAGRRGIGDADTRRLNRIKCGESVTFHARVRNLSVTGFV